MKTETETKPTDPLARLLKPHIGLSRGRLNPNQDNPRELAFALQWAHENEHPGSNLLAHLIPEHSDRDAQVAATIIQWRGSNVGMSFLVESIRREPKIKEWLHREIYERAT
jgi:hypothetical protein